jgi:Zn-dependent protease
VALLAPFVWRDIFSDSEVVVYSVASMTAQLCFANLFMGCFNLVPVFPMDGGRIFRALLAIKLPYLRATWWAVMVARGLGAVLIAWALYQQNYLQAALFTFIIFAGNLEYQFTLRREQEEAYWAEMARRVAAAGPANAEPPLLIHHGPN